MTHAAGQAGLNGIIVYIFYRFVLFVYWHNHPDDAISDVFYN